MTRIVAPEDCGNAPKKAFLRDFNVAFATGDIDHLLQCVTDDVQWRRIGDDTIEGIDNFAKALNEMKNNVATELVLETLITHGNTASANGTIAFGDKTYAFCDVYLFRGFKNAKLKTITSYVLEI